MVIVLIMVKIMSRNGNSFEFVLYRGTDNTLHVLDRDYLENSEIPL